jgi:hypothetical protein
LPACILFFPPHHAPSLPVHRFYNSRIRYAAAALIGCLLDSFWLALGLIVSHQLIEQWLIQAGRRLAFQEALKRRSAAQAEEEGRESVAPDAREVSSPIAEPAVDLIMLSAESRKLIDTVLRSPASLGSAWFGRMCCRRFESLTSSPLALLRCCRRSD